MAAKTTRPEPPVEEHEDHGHTVAAWTAVIGAMIGFLVMSIGVAITTLWMFIVGAVIVVISGILGKVLSTMGYGAAPDSVHRGRPGARAAG